ncbi:MAG: mannose-1-phosphate guanylyltransferase [Candidatus Poriferisodalaceae bacterium]
MKALVLVGGFGTRLRPLTLTTPKQMLPIAGYTMIEWVVDRLNGHGVDEVILSLGYRPDAFLEAFPRGKISGLPFRVAVEPEPRGTAGAVRFAADEVELDETFVVLNGDVLTDLNIGDLIRFHKSAGAEATIALQPVADPSRFGVVSTASDGRVLEFVEKPPAGTAPTSNINAGTYVLEPSVLARIPQDIEVSIERETFPALVESRSLYAMATDTYWLDTGTPAQYLEANIDIVSGRREFPGIKPVQGEVSSTATVVDSFVGPGSRISGGAIVRRSVILDDCVVGAGAVIEDSILANGVVVGGQARLRNGCVIGRNETVPPGVSLDGVRQPAPE